MNVFHSIATSQLVHNGFPMERRSVRKMSCKDDSKGILCRGPLRTSASYIKEPGYFLFVCKSLTRYGLVDSLAI